jgi:hypothetical protein
MSAPNRLKLESFARQREASSISAHDRSEALGPRRMGRRVVQ